MVRHLATQLGNATGLTIEAELERAMGVDPETGCATPNGPVAIGTMEELRQIAIGVVTKEGMDERDAGGAVDAVWMHPTPSQAPFRSRIA